MITITFWGTRGSTPTPGPEMTRYGGNTACVEVRGSKGTHLVLDAGSGIRRLGALLPQSVRRVDLLLTHLHIDQIQGLAFFKPLYDPTMEIHLWGPATHTLSLRQGLMRSISPPLFPVYLGELPCHLFLHEVPHGPFDIGEFHIESAWVCHPGATVGYRITQADTVFAYLPDHEPALGCPAFPMVGEWTSGYALAYATDLLIHDAQYSAEQYERQIGWGHSSIHHALAFAALARVKHLVPFHHDPTRIDDAIDDLITAAVMAAEPTFAVTPASEGMTLTLGAHEAG